MSYNQPLSIAQPATPTVAGTIALAGDLTGNPLAPTVAGVNGVVISGIPSAGQVPTATSANTATWSQPAGQSAIAKRVFTDTFNATTGNTPNAATTDIYRLVLTANGTLNTPSGTPVDGQQLQVHLIQDGTGSRTITFGPGYSFSTDIPLPVLSTTAGATDYHGFQYSATASRWRLLALVRGF